MMGTRERKILVAILGLGALALIVDRVVLSSGATGPDQAAAEVTAAAREASPSNPPEPVMPLLPLDDAGPILSARLKEAAEAQDISVAEPRNAFQPAVSWVGAPDPEQAAPSARPMQTAPPDPVQTFRDSHRLIAVMVNQGQGVAIVNGRTVHVGEQVDGFTLQRVDRRAAVFVFGDVRVRLTVEHDE